MKSVRKVATIVTVNTRVCWVYWVGVKQQVRHRFTMTTAMTISFVIRYLSFRCNYLLRFDWLNRFIFDHVCTLLNISPPSIALTFPRCFAIAMTYIIIRQIAHSLCMYSVAFKEKSCRQYDASYARRSPTTGTVEKRLRIFVFNIDFPISLDVTFG